MILSVCDVTGRAVAVLVNEALSPGTYEFTWDASAFASGVYFYQLTVTNQNSVVFKETKKMLLMK